MRQILASFFCFGENLVKSNEVKTNLTKGVLSKEKFVNLLRYKNLKPKFDLSVYDINGEYFEESGIN